MDNEKDFIVPSQDEANEKSGYGSGAEKSAGGPAAQSEPATDLAEAYEKLKAEKDALYDRLLRKQAELENFRKRTQREREDFLQHATVDLIRALLPTLDGFERALAHGDGPVASAPALADRHVRAMRERALAALEHGFAEGSDEALHAAAEDLVAHLTRLGPDVRDARRLIAAPDGARRELTC